MPKVISHEKSGNLVRVHYTADGAKEGFDSGSVAYHRNDILLPKIGDEIVLPKLTNEALEENENIEYAHTGNTNERANRIGSPTPDTNISEISAEGMVPTRPHFVESSGDPNVKAAPIEKVTL